MMMSSITTASGAMDVLSDSTATATQKMGSLMSVTMSLGNAFATGGIWGALAAGAAMAVTAAVKYF